MSSLGSGRPLKGYVRDSRRRKMVLDVDLNDMPPLEGRTEEETSAGIVLQEVRSVETGGVLPPATTIDVEAIDDEVVISSPRSFEEARNKSRRNHGVTVVIDEDIEVQQGHSDIQFTRLAHNRYTKRRSIPPNQTIISYDFFINLDGGHSTEKNHVKSPEPSQSMPQPKEPTFSCPVCMGPLNEEMSTKCGHIFCKKCIKAAITAQHKCPTCRRKLTMRDILRVYLPATS